LQEQGQGQGLDSQGPGQGQGPSVQGPGQRLDLQRQGQGLDLQGQGPSLQGPGQGQGLDLQGSGQVQGQGLTSLLISSSKLSPPLPSTLAPITSTMETFCYRLTQVRLVNGR